jgi:hypothetical protein
MAKNPFSLNISTSFFLIRIVWGGVHTGFTRHVGHFWPIVPAPGDIEDGEFGGMKIGRGNQGTRRKPAPAPLCPHKSHLTRHGLELGPPRREASD